MIAQYLPKLVKKGGSMPLYVTFFVTNRCNLKCEHCFYSAELNKPTQELTLEEIEKMAKSMDQFPVMLYSGGEPFLRKDLAEITHAFYKYNKINYLSIPTNGTFLKNTEEIVTKMCELCPKLTIVIDFSIDGLQEEHNRIRGSPQSYQNAIRTFHVIKGYKQKYKNLRVGFVTTFTATNQDTINEVYDNLKAQNPDNISINLIRGVPKNPLVKNIDISKYKAVTKRVQEDLMQVNLPGFDPFLASMASYRYDMVTKTYEENKFQTTCYSSQISCVIYPNGDVFPCEILDETKKIGNIRDFQMNFRELWNSPRNKELAQWIVGTKCFCTHECNIAANMAFNPKHFTKIAMRAAVLSTKKVFNAAEEQQETISLPVQS
ncbi:MAG TPA: radical SAM protein [Candidatus Nanoarchaeia archaeon]|nr:radical SAM protein [Candidatus Nanoarchaeia archaeon]